MSVRRAAVFLDRDGTLNVEINRLSKADQLELIPEAGKAVRRLNRAGLLAIVITNQAVIARGDCTEDELERIHNKLETLLGESGAYVDGLYHCPHHPDSGFPGERSELKIECDCRKPGTRMIERAVSDLFVAIEDSWMVGDTTTDLQTAHNAGVRSVLVRTGYGGRDQRWPARPDYEFFDLSQAVDFIVDRHAPALEQARRSLPTCAAGSLLTIGGLARSGKSTWASLFCEVLAERGQRGVVLPLETWLRSRTDREPGDVLDRFDAEAITAAVKRLQGRRHACVELTLGHYDRFSGERDERGLTISIEPEDIVLFEGVPALAIEALVAASSASFYVECSETVRRGRFDREYQGRGLSKTETEALYLEREADEHPLIKRSASVADVRIGVGP